MAKTPKTNKSAFVRSLPADTSAADVVKAAAAKGIKLTDKFVHTIRYNAKVAAAKKAGKRALGGGGEIPIPLAKRGPGRPRKVASSNVGGLEAEIERIVEKAVERLLKARLGALLGG